MVSVMCIHTRKCMAYMHVSSCRNMCLSVHIWRPEVVLGYLSLVISSLVLRQCLIEPGACHAAPGILLSLPSSIGVMGHHHQAQFFMQLGIQTQVLILAKQMLYPLSHLPSPTSVLHWCIGMGNRIQIAEILEVGSLPPKLY